MTPCSGSCMLNEAVGTDKSTHHKAIEVLVSRLQNASEGAAQKARRRRCQGSGGGPLAHCRTLPFACRKFVVTHGDKHRPSRLRGAPSACHQETEEGAALRLRQAGQLLPTVPFFLFRQQFGPDPNCGSAQIQVLFFCRPSASGRAPCPAGLPAFGFVPFL